MPTVLIADDRKDGIELISETLGDVLDECNVTTTVSYERALELILQADIAVVDNDWSETGSGPRNGGVRLLSHAKGQGHAVRGIVVTAYDPGQRLETIRRVLSEKLADDWIPKPDSTGADAISLFKADLRRVFKNAYANVHAQREVEILKQGQTKSRTELVRDFPTLPRSVVGTNPSFLCALRTALEASRSDEPTLLIGESGTGKRVVADSMAVVSGREPLHILHPGHRSESMLMTDLFGYPEDYPAVGTRRGGKAGLIEQAQGRILLLDDLQRIPLAVQSSILNAIENCEIVRPMESRVRALNPKPKFVATIGLQPAEAIKQNLLEKDLANRFLVPIELPPMRDRPEDVMPILEYECEKKGIRPDITPGAVEVLREYFCYRIEGHENVRAIQAIARLANREKRTVLDASLMRNMLERLGMRFGRIPAKGIAQSQSIPSTEECVDEWCALVKRDLVGSCKPVYNDILKHRADGGAYPGAGVEERDELGLVVLEGVLERYGGPTGYSKTVCQGKGEAAIAKHSAAVRAALKRARRKLGRDQV